MCCTVIPYRRAVTGHSPSSSPGFRHMRRQRSAARDSRACHGHTGAPHMGRLTHHNTPGPVGRPRRDSVGHTFIASVGAGGVGQGTRGMLIPTQQRDPQWAGTTVHTRVPTPRHPHMLARGEQHGQSRAPQPLVIPAAFVPNVRAHTARTAHTAHPHSPPAARMMHTSRGKVVCDPHRAPRNAGRGCRSARASTRRRSVMEAVSPTRPPSSRRRRGSSRCSSGPTRAPRGLAAAARAAGAEGGR